MNKEEVIFMQKENKNIANERKDTLELLSIEEASDWASNFLKREISNSNISYLIQYGRVRKISDNGAIRISKDELRTYYKDQEQLFESKGWDDKQFKDLNWTLSFREYREAETTKHVHRLHPYKGKFIPQMVEYFLDDHVDEFKEEVYFKPGDIVLDPFSGSGTTMVQACELGIHALGIDVSAFNTVIGNSKVAKYNIIEVQENINYITQVLEQFEADNNIAAFENKLLNELNSFNSEHFPSPDYRYKVRKGQINEMTFGHSKEQEFLDIYNKLIEEYGIKLRQEKNNTFLDKWYSEHIRNEIDLVFNEIKKIKNIRTKRIISIILSRTIRSCRATTHSDLATLIEPVTSTYYCKKHGKICKPLFSIIGWWKRYSKDTIQRIQQFDKIRKDTFHTCIQGDSRSVNILQKLDLINPKFSDLIKKKKIKGVFSSPPYVGLIDYHEQHAYAYDLFGFERNDDLEIGPLYRGRGKVARESYIEGVSQVLKNCKKYLADDFDVFLVANDRYNMYPKIAENANMQIVKEYKRPVLNRTEKDKNPYSESIFHLKRK